MVIRGLVFDIFGTVVDWRSSIAGEVRALCRDRGLTADGEAVADSWRRRYQPSMERVRTGAVGWRNLDDLHRESLDDVLAELKLDLSIGDRDHLNRAWHRLDPWPDALDGLGLLRRDFTIGTLSNGNFSLLTDLVKHSGLPFDCIISAEILGAYKPDPRTYKGAARLLGLPPSELMMVAAHPDDLVAAAACGLRTAYVHRPLEWGPGPPMPSPPETFDVRAADLVDLAHKLTLFAHRP